MPVFDRLAVIWSLLPLLAMAFAMELAAQVPPLRTYILDLGVPGMELEVNGRSAGTTGEQGTLRMDLTSGAGDELRIRSRSPAWHLDVIKIVPPDDPEIPIQWNLSPHVVLVPAPAVEAVAAPEDEALVDPLVEPETESSLETDTVPAAESFADPCLRRGSLRCRQARWERFERAAAALDCPAAEAAIDALADEEPGLLGSEPVLAFAATLLDCGLVTAGEAARRRLRRTVELVEGYAGNEAFCRVREARLLGRALDALGEHAAAAAAAAVAGERCGGPALEWEMYFRLRLDELDRAAHLAAAAPGRLGTFLRAWLELVRGECGTEVELLPTGELPCSGLPRQLCSWQYGRILLACGIETDDFVTAARYLRDALPVDPATWGELAASGGQDRLVELAEAELRGERFAEAERLYRLVLEADGGAAATDRTVLWRRLGDAALLGGADARALAAYQQARQDLTGAPAAFALVMSNICVLRARLDEIMTSPDLARDLDILAAAVDAVPAAAEGARRLLRHNLLALRIRLLEDDPTIDAQEKLERLRAWHAAFTEVRAELLRAPAVDAESETFEVEGGRYVLALP